ncbi:cyclase family protein, partial [Slackia piriformis]|uniref:cyclase family protein n=1 Tax=Slackia piriformis TaxID=626934 RepID=UPI0026F7CDA1|nr:cyclase family protein [Slackia piriformis]
LRTDWYKRWPSYDALCNFDEEGGEHCPGWSIETLKFLFEERGVAMNGHETFDTDASYLAVEADDLAVERYVLDTCHLQVEVMANLDKVPLAGVRVLGRFMLPTRISEIAQPDSKRLFS